jgi:hypothetical protein
MNLDNIFSSATDTIFKQFDSISVEVQFTQVLSGGFNFSTGQPNLTTSTVTVRGVPVSERSEGATTSPSNRKKLYLKSGSIVPSYYSSVRFNSEDYNIVSYEDSGYVIKLELIKDR